MMIALHILKAPQQREISFKLFIFWFFVEIFISNALVIKCYTQILKEKSCARVITCLKG